MPQPNISSSWVQDTLGLDYGIVALTAIVEADLYDYEWINAGVGPQGSTIDTNIQHSPGVWFHPIDAESFGPPEWDDEAIEITNTDSSATSEEIVYNSAP